MVNLGFGGGARGEPEVAELISSLAMSAFIMDYDHNAPDAEFLNKTHEPFFNIIRKAHPSLPVIIISRPDFDDDPCAAAARREVIRVTYRNALNAGDRHVSLINGQELFGETDRDACTVDTCHPNDLGFMRMAERIFPVVKQALF
ncbi:MAG TPA: hypothetical protein DD727_05925 [Clostridiales bacterium]|nr:hypothetical protein [Clostridiales bacterium]